MKLADLSNLPDWIVWAAFIAVAILSAVFISGHGSGLISGYNVASKEKKRSITKNAYAGQWELEWLS